jgi:hypothetical protein
LCQFHLTLTDSSDIGDFANPASQPGAVHEAHFHRAVSIDREELLFRRRTVGGWHLSKAIAAQKRGKHHRESFGCHLNCFLAGRRRLFPGIADTDEAVHTPVPFQIIRD